MKALRTLAKWYLQSWMLLLWSAACVCFGAGWALFVLASYFKARGML